ncbi:MAG TPA: carbohydrate-binding protein, partial [Flavisolibacter sp.]|nr:carbohydrate-binding protein [Flavisolibacter sp.]
MSTPSTLRIEAEDYASMYGVITEVSGEGGKNVGAISPGDWMDYKVSVPAAGSYKMNFRVAGPGGQFQLKNASGAVLATVTSPKTSGYQGYTTVSANVNLAAGQQTLRIYAVSGGYNINWFELVGGSTSSTGATSGTVRIEAEDYASMYGVITEVSGEGGKNVGAISPGDWMDYKVSVPAAG